MALYQVAPGSKVLAEDLNQLVKNFRGLAAHPMLVSGNFVSAYLLDLHTTQTGSAVPIFKVRSDAGAFINVTTNGLRISADGVNFDRIPVTTLDTQTIKNKSIDGDENTITDIGTSSLKDDSVSESKMKDDSVSSRTLRGDIVHGKHLGIVEGCALRKSGDQSLNIANWTTVTWDTEVYDASSGDTGGQHSTPNERIEVERTGLWRFEAIIKLKNSDQGFAEVQMVGNNSFVHHFGAQAAVLESDEPDWFWGTIVWYERLNAGDWRALEIKRGNCNPPQHIEGGNDGSYFYAHRVGA